MHQILLVEDSTMFGRLIKSKVEKVFDVPVYWAKSLAETESLLTMAKANFSLALLDFNLPDAPQGEVIDRVLAEGISTLVITGDFSDDVRNFVWSRKVADYILKEDPNSLEYIITVIKQLQENQNTLVLVVDDSNTFRGMVSELLYVRRFRVLNAADAVSALEILQKYPEIQLVLTGYNLPGIDGCRFCQKIREMYKPERLVIIGFPSATDGGLGARFIKSGANDFIVKQSFLVEEFYCRINHCLEKIKLFAQIREGTIRDFLTGLHNRKHFFSAGTEMIVQSHINHENVGCVLLDIDDIKKINDTYGFTVGDQVIQKVAAILKEESGKRDIVARVDGEDFCILTPSTGKEELVGRCEKLRNRIAVGEAFTTDDAKSINVTVSIGICAELQENLDVMMKIADDNLDKAKENGRNRVESGG